MTKPNKCPTGVVVGWSQTIPRPPQPAGEEYRYQRCAPQGLSDADFSAPTCPAPKTACSAVVGAVPGPVLGCRARGAPAAGQEIALKRDRSAERTITSYSSARSSTVTGTSNSTSASGTYQAGVRNAPPPVHVISHSLYFVSSPLTSRKSPCSTISECSARI